MKKHEEYKLKFIKHRYEDSSLRYYIDFESAVDGDKNLSFIYILDSILINHLLVLINDAQNGRYIEPNCLDDQEEFIFFQLKFNPPYFSIDGDMKIIHMDDFKQLLIEWKEFRWPKHEQYNVKFSKTFNPKTNRHRYSADWIINTSESFTISSKLNQLYVDECQFLVNEIVLAQNGQPFEPSFTYGRTMFSDYDYIEIKNNNTIDIDTVIFPLEDIKEILEEWIAFAGEKIDVTENSEQTNKEMDFTQDSVNTNKIETNFFKRLMQKIFR